MESEKEFNIDFIGRDHTAHVRDIVAVNVYLFRKTIMSINNDDDLKFDDKYRSSLAGIYNYIKRTRQCLLNGIYKLCEQSQKLTEKNLTTPRHFQRLHNDRYYGYNESY